MLSDFSTDAGSKYIGKNSHLKAGGVFWNSSIINTSILQKKKRL
jgi:hypothetical protein